MRVANAVSGGRLPLRGVDGDHPQLQVARRNLAVRLKSLGDLEGARALEQVVLDVYTRTLPGDHLELQNARLNLAFTLFDLGVVRGLVLPVALYTALRATGAPSRNDVISPNLFSWMIALGLVLAAFNFSEALVSEPGEPQTLVAIAIAGVLLGFLVLASAAGPFGQMVGALRIENAIALLELSGSHRASLGMRLALLGIFLATLGFFRWHLLSTASPAKEGEHAPDSFTL